MRGVAACRRLPMPLLTQHFIARLLNHVRADDGAQAVRLHPSAGHIQAKHVGHAAGAGAPAAHVGAGVGPQQVAVHATLAGAHVLPD